MVRISEDNAFGVLVSAPLQDTIEARMNRLSELLLCVRKNQEMAANFLGLLNVLIGRRITAPSGEVVSPGLNWREAAALLRNMRWDKAAVRQLGLDPTRLPPRDRARFWYAAIAQAGVDSANAYRAGDQLAAELKGVGFLVSPNPCK
jgi:hypothetical protein